MPAAIAIFNDSFSLQRALDDLHSSGIGEDRIRIIEGAGGDADTTTAAEGGMVQGGASSPGVTPGDNRVGAPGTGFPAVGGVGPFVTPGSTSGTPMPGVAAGGRLDSLRDFDIDDEEARYFSDSLNEDTHLLAVRVDDDEDARRVYDIFRRAGANRSNEPSR